MKKKLLPIIIIGTGIGIAGYMKYQKTARALDGWYKNTSNKQEQYIHIKGRQCDICTIEHIHEGSVQVCREEYRIEKANNINAYGSMYNLKIASDDIKYNVIHDAKHHAVYIINSDNRITAQYEKCPVPELFI